MLKKSHISTIKANTDAWYDARLGKFTSSKMSMLTYPSGFTEGSIRYIRERVGEELTGESADREIVTEAIIHGRNYEKEALRRFGIQMGLEFIVTQQLITAPESRFGSTPDGLIVLRVNPDGLEYEVETVEVKCPLTYSAYIGLFECDTPEQIKKEDRDYYWQVVDQIHQAGAKRGHFVIYHPKFKAGNHKTIIFDPMAAVLDKGKPSWPIRDDLKLLQERKDMALKKFDEIRAKLMRVPAL